LPIVFAFAGDSTMTSRPLVEPVARVFVAAVLVVFVVFAFVVFVD
jgi:hypothetical protein